jgi:hypothetical protein
MCDLDEPPKNKLRKVIFNDNSGLSLSEKLTIVGQLIGKTKRIHQDDIYQCMLDINDMILNVLLEQYIEIWVMNLKKRKNF